MEYVVKYYHILDYLSGRKQKKKGGYAMQIVKKSKLYENNRVLFIRSSLIKPNPAQPRQLFEMDGLRELAESISLHGILQPLTVRRTLGGYELVAGERRLRASKMAGLSAVPCIVLDVDAEQSSLFALIENLQRRDLDFFEEAEGIERLIHIYHMSQEEAASKLGKSQSAIANKLRLLRHPPELVVRIREGGLTERHARALLRLEEYADRLKAAEQIIEQKMNVAQTEEYIENLLAAKPPVTLKPCRPQPLYVWKDIRFFLNTVGRAVATMKKTGVSAGMEKAESEQEIVVTIRIPKQVQ